MDKLKTKIKRIKKDIENLTSKYCTEKFSVMYYGAFDIDPKHLVYWICVQTDKIKHDLENNEILGKDLRELLDINDYPIDSRKFVAIGFESQETVNRESNGTGGITLNKSINLKRKHYFILIIVLLIAGGLFLALYEMRLLYYEENKADRLTNLIFGPIFLLLLIYILISEFISTKKRWRFDWKKYLKFVGTSIIGIAVAFFVFFKPVISGLILLLNTNIGYQEPIQISGRVIDKYEYSGKGAEFELTILSTDDKVYKFDTFGTETKKYEIGYNFEMEMFKGLFGLVYIKNNIPPTLF